MSLFNKYNKNTEKIIDIITGYSGHLKQRICNIIEHNILLMKDYISDNQKIYSGF